MTLAIDRLSRSPHQDMQFTRLGVGVPVIHAETGKIKTQIDAPRDATNRSGGSISFAFETRKRGETLKENVLGAFPEMLNDRTLSVVKNKLFTTDELQSTEEIHDENCGKPVDYSLAVIIFDGSLNTPFRAYDHKEATPFGWMDPEEFLDLPVDATRPLARNALLHLSEQGIIKQKLEEYNDSRVANKLVIPEGFNIAEYYKDREKKKDMQPGEHYYLHTE